MHVVTRWLGILFVVLVLGIILFGVPFATGMADLGSDLMDGFAAFFAELRNNNGNAVG